MSFKSEAKVIRDRLMREIALAEKLDETAVGRDGPGTVAAREATQRYNEAIIALRKKYHMDET